MPRYKVQYITKSHCRDYLLRRAEAKWGKKMERVADSCYEHLDYVLMREMDALVRYHPTVGKTLMHK